MCHFLEYDKTLYKYIYYRKMEKLISIELPEVIQSLKDKGQINQADFINIVSSSIHYNSIYINLLRELTQSYQN